MSEHLRQHHRATAALLTFSSSSQHSELHFPVPSACADNAVPKFGPFDQRLWEPIKVVLIRSIRDTHILSESD